MNKNQIFSIALRILGIIFLFRALGGVLQLIALLTADKQNPVVMSFFQVSQFSIILQAVFVLFYLIFGYLFLFRPKKISEKLMPGKSTETITRENILEIVTCYIGIELGVFSLQGLIFFLSYAITSPEIKNNPTIFATQAIIYILQIGAGILILRNYSKIAKFLTTKIPEKFWVK